MWQGGGVGWGAAGHGVGADPASGGTVHDIVAERGDSIIDAGGVAGGGMEILEARANGTQWIVWGDEIRQHIEPTLI